MSSFREKQGGGGAPGGDSAQSAPPQDQGRRRFSKRALAGGAVLVSLGNRAAWGQTVVGCMSVTTIASFNPATGMFISAPGGRPEHNEALATEIHAVSDPLNGDYFATGPGTDGQTYTTCQDPDDIDGVCLVEGSSCPP